MDETNRYASSIALPFDAEVKTAKGWNKIKSVNTTMKTSCIRLATKSTSLVCSRNHRIMDASGEFIFAEDCLGAFVQTEHGIEEVQKIEDAGSMQLLDLSLDGDHTYLTNAIVSHNCVCIDEACYVSNLDQILQAIAPTLTRDNNAQLVFTTTPAGKNSQFYRIYEKALDDDEWLVQKTTIYDAVKDGLKVDVKSLMKLCPDPDIFAQEYECQWAASSSSLCKSEDLDFKDMLEESSSRDVLLAVDVGVKHDKTAMAVGKEIDGVLNVVECTVLDKMPFEKQLKAIQAVEAKYHVKAGVIDANGVGYGLAEMVAKQCSRLIKPYTWSQKTKANAHEMLRTDILTHKIAFPESVKQQVIDDFERVQKTITDSGKAVWTAKHDKTGHADLATAIAMLDDLWHKKPANASIIQTAPIPSVF